MGHRVTLQTIADALNVSRSTVSNAYNRPDQLAPELRARILETARSLGYPGPDPAARRLRRGSSGAIGLLFTEALSYAFTDPAAVRFLEGLARASEAGGTALLLIPAPPGADAAAAVRDAVVDGLCVYSMPEGHPTVAAVLARSLPTIVVDEPRIAGVSFLGIDDRGGARAVAEHVVGLGHLRIGVITTRLSADGYEGLVDAERLREATFAIERDRLAGFQDALEAAGIAWEGVPILERENAQAGGEEAASLLLEGAPGLTALLCTTDQLALGALRSAGHLAITGFDDVPEAAAAGLTTVRQPLLDKGLRAGELLLALMDGAGPRDVALPVELVVRRSTVESS